MVHHRRCGFVCTPFGPKSFQKCEADFDFLCRFTFQQRKSLLPLPFPSAPPDTCQSRIAGSSQQGQPNIAASVRRIPDAPVTHVLQEPRFIQQSTMKSASSAHKYRNHSRSVSRRFSCSLRSLCIATHRRGWCKVAAYDILRRKEVVKISGQRSPYTGRLYE